MTHTDIFIIGGGINGVGIATDAAGRGLSVTFCEKSDLASATSSASSKLIHGGLRYLEFYEFNLVRKALIEREILLRKAPHLISPLEFILPHEKNSRPAWMIRLGLFIYDHLTKRKLIPRSKAVNLAKGLFGEPLLEKYKKGFSYYDCRADDGRLVITNAIQAKELGANILTQTTFLSAHYENNRWHISVQDNASKKISSYSATVLINVTGPWVAEIQTKISGSKPLQVSLVKGSHIIVPKIYHGDFAYLLQNADKRIVFAIPYQEKFTLIGTTDIPYQNNLEQPTVTPDERKYLCDSINQYFQRKISPTDIIWEYSGVRCLKKDNEHDAHAITRDYFFDFHDVPGPLLSVISGKITTYRCLAEEALEKLKSIFPQMKPAWTAKKALPGGDIPNANFPSFLIQLKKEFSQLPDDLVLRFAKNYGTRSYLILKNVKTTDDLGAHFGHHLYQKEVEYLIAHEWAKTAEDILWRRTKLGLYFSTAEYNALAMSLTQS